jgi:hypothetical protein
MPAKKTEPSPSVHPQPAISKNAPSRAAPVQQAPMAVRRPIFLSLLRSDWVVWLSQQAWSRSPVCGALRQHHRKCLAACHRQDTRCI